MRKSLIVLALVLGLTAAPIAVLAASGRLSSSADLQLAKWTTTSHATSSRQWRNVARLSRLTACTLNEVSATLSVTIVGAPAAFRIVVDAVPEAPMRPGAARFVPDGKESFSYTFVGNTAPFENDDTHVFDVQWRSPTGRRVTLLRGDLNLLFQQGTHNCP